jgi:hypothetical protein
VRQPKLATTDRLTWVWLCAVWKDWQSDVFIVNAPTVNGSYRNGFRLFWSWRIRLDNQNGRAGIRWHKNEFRACLWWAFPGSILGEVVCRDEPLDDRDVLQLFSATNGLGNGALVLAEGGAGALYFG